MVKKNKLEEVNYDSIKTGVYAIGLFGILKATETSPSWITLIIGLMLYILIYRILLIYIEFIFAIENYLLDKLKIKSDFKRLIFLPILIICLMFLILISSSITQWLM